MALSYSPSIATFEGNGIAVDFPFTFKVWDVSQLKVAVVDVAGVESTPHFSASLTDTGGTVNFLHQGVPLPVGWKLSIVRNMPFEQGVDLVSGTRFDPQVIEDQLDKATAERQQLREGFGRAIAIPAGYKDSPQELLNKIFEAKETSIAKADAAAMSAEEAAQIVEDGSTRIGAEADAQVTSIIEKGETQIALAKEQADIAVGSAASSLASQQEAAQSADDAAESARIAQEALELGSPTATDINKGVVYLSDAIDSDSDSSGATAATPLAVLKAIDDAAYTAEKMDLDMRWNLESTYTRPCVRVGNDRRLYLWLKRSGRDVTGVGAKDPEESGNGEYWVDYAENTGQVLRPFFDTHSGKVYYPGYAGQFKSFQLPTPPENWMVCTGGWLDSADVSYQELWRNLNHPAFATLVVTDAQWTGKSTAAGGVGGVPFFVVDAAAKRIRLPDTRGDYTRAAGSSYLQTVGDWHEDAIRNITGLVSALMYREDNMGGVSGAFSRPSTNWGGVLSNAYGTASSLALDASRVVKTAADNRTRGYGTLGCVCVGPTQTHPSVP